MDLKKFVRDIPDFPKPGVSFKDITPLLKDPEGAESSLRCPGGIYWRSKDRQGGGNGKQRILLWAGVGSCP